MKSLQEALTSIADRNLYYLGIWTNAPDTLCRCLIGLLGSQTAFE
jgi:hypothetical protein